jgi:MMP 1-O-methyltransferase
MQSLMALPMSLTKRGCGALRCWLRDVRLVRAAVDSWLALVDTGIGGRSRSLHGSPDRLATSPLQLAVDRMRWGALGEFIWRSRRIPGWTRGAEAAALARASYSCPEGATVVEIGSFLGRSTVLLAGARKLKGSGRVHCVDSFDASGDAFSVPVYRTLLSDLPLTLRQAFDDNLRNAGLTDWVEVHEGRDEDVAKNWTTAIDLLFMDADHSYEAVRQTYDRWSPFLKPGGVIAIHNSCLDRSYAPNHDGSMRLVKEFINLPLYTEPVCTGSTTFATRTI